jgi:hypothetical protein
LKINSQLVENYKVTAKAAAKRKTLVHEEAALLEAERSVASKRQRLDQKRQRVDLAIRVSLTSGVPPIRSPPASLRAGSSSAKPGTIKPWSSARQRVVEEHYKRLTPEGISPLLACKEATKSSASAAPDESKAIEELIFKAFSNLSSNFLVPPKKRVLRVKPAEKITKAPTRRTQAEHIKISAPTPHSGARAGKADRPPRHPPLHQARSL